jgi:hypothetical protein
MEDKEISFEIVRRLGPLARPSARGWTKELNLVSWNGREAKYDIREWSEDHQKMGKGVTLGKDEARVLVGLLGQDLG